MATPPKKSLGRGLGNLIGGGLSKPAVPPVAPVAAVPAVPGLTLIELVVGTIIPNPRQPRRDFDEGAVKELAESIRSEGLLQPIVVRKVKDGFELIAGERRLRAFKHLGQKTVDEALGVASLMRDFSLTQEAVADRIGKPRATVANSVRLLQLDREILGYLGKGQLSSGHAKALLGLEQATQRIQIARLIIEKGLSVRATEAEVKTLAAGKKADRKRTEKTVVADVQKRLSSHFSSPVSVVRKGAKGTIAISFSSDDDLARLLEKIGIKL
ncbi:MAG: ParB/RepB/Spo0J family partition protein [Verrucomicrobia bacterium]|nr:ParB/RepB/Spo0J family partition protein [Verrucomicrobiota bacterium]